MLYKIVAYDGLSLAGKSTMVQMTLEKSVDAVVIRENTRDPHRPTTSKVNKLMKKLGPYEAIKIASEEFPDSKQVLENAIKYSSQFRGYSQKQAILAYLFTAGRTIVNDYLRKVVEKHDVILDRWQMTGWAYQIDPAGYTWQDVRRLNEEFGITMPDIQIILTCPVNQVQIRRAYRDKLQIGTAGMMSIGREPIILQAYDEIYDQLKDKMPICMFENEGTPVKNLDEQIKQAIPTFQKKIEPFLIENGFRLKEQENTKPFWLNPERLDRIRKRQM